MESSPAPSVITNGGHIKGSLDLKLKRLPSDFTPPWGKPSELLEHSRSQQCWSRMECFCYCSLTLAQNLAKSCDCKGDRPGLRAPGTGSIELLRAQPPLLCGFRSSCDQGRLGQPSLCLFRTVASFLVSLT